MPINLFPDSMADIAHEKAMAEDNTLIWIPTPHPRDIKSTNWRQQQRIRIFNKSIETNVNNSFFPLTDMCLEAGMVVEKTKFEDILPDITIADKITELYRWGMSAPDDWWEALDKILQRRWSQLPTDLAKHLAKDWSSLPKKNLMRLITFYTQNLRLSAMLVLAELAVSNEGLEKVDGPESNQQNADNNERVKLDVYKELATLASNNADLIKLSQVVAERKWTSIGVLEVFSSYLPSYPGSFKEPGRANETIKDLKAKRLEAYHKAERDKRPIVGKGAIHAANMADLKVGAVSGVGGLWGPCEEMNDSADEDVELDEFINFEDAKEEEANQES